MMDNSQVRKMRDNSQVGEMRNNSQVGEMRGYAKALLLFSFASVNCMWYNYIWHYENQNNIKINSNETTIIHKLPTIEVENNIDMYIKLYPIEKRDTKLIFYKAVRKVDWKYVSDYDNRFEYFIWKVATQKVDIDENNACWAWLHIAYKSRAINFGKHWNNVALLEVEVNPNDIYVPKNCGWKVRTSQLNVIREVPREEWF